MLKLLKSLLGRKDCQKLSQAEEKFDVLMDELDKDQSDLDQLARHIKGEFKDINGDVRCISEEIDEIAQ